MFLILTFIMQIYCEQKHERAQCQELGGEDSDELNDIQIRLKADRSSGSKRSGCTGGGGSSDNPVSSSKISGPKSYSPPAVTMSSSRLNATTNPVTTVTTALVTLPSPAVVELESRGTNGQGTSSSASPTKKGSVQISTL